MSLLDPRKDGIRWVVPGKIAACSRAWIEGQWRDGGKKGKRYAEHEFAFLLSIRDEGSSKVEPSLFVPAYLTFFDDVPDGRNAIDEDEARRIAKRVTRRFPLLCQCEHGQSRSVAVALAVADHYGWDVPEREQYEPNPLVYRLIKEALQAARLEGEG